MVQKTCTSSSFAEHRPLPRGGRGRFTITALIAYIAICSPAFACADDEATLFSCLAQDQSHTIELCAVRDDAAGGFQSLQYRYGTAEKQELVFPENRRDGKQLLSFAHAFDKNTYVWSLRFANADYTYRVFGMGEEAGVEVWRKKKRLAQVMCGERPYAMTADIRRAAACDMKNPFGAEGCGENPPARK
jgi:hypothetical protein